MYLAERVRKFASYWRPSSQPSPAPNSLRGRESLRGGIHALRKIRQLLVSLSPTLSREKYPHTIPIPYAGEGV